MKREEIIAKWDGLSARERDAWVAEVVFGWERTSGVMYAILPQYTTDIGAAWAVLELPGADGLSTVWAIYPTSDSYNVEYALGHDIVSAETAPEAICLAALIAKLTEVSA